MGNDLLSEIGFTSIFDDDVVDADFLSEIPVSLIESSLEEQFLEPFEYRKKDYIEEYFIKYNDLKENDVLEDEYKQVDEEHDEFISYVCQLFEKFLDISFVNIDDRPIDEQHELIHNTYIYFIKNIKKNFVNAVCNEIKENYNHYVKEIATPRKDVTYYTFKQEIENEEDAILLSNLTDVVNAAIENIKENYSVNKFFDISDYGEADTARAYVINAYNEFDLTGNFVSLYCDMVDEDIVNEIESKVRKFILKKYPVRKKKDMSKELEDTNIEDTDTTE